MKNLILSIALIGCGQKPDSSYIDTNLKTDTTKEHNIRIPETDIVFNSEFLPDPEPCSTHIVNKDHYFRVMPVQERKKICNLIGIDQRGDAFELYDFLGNITVLVIMNPVCEECLYWLNTDDLYHLIARYEGVRLIKVITRNANYEWAGADDVKQLHTNYNLGNYPVVAITPEQIGYADNQFQPYRTDRQFPMFYFIDKKMNLVWATVPFQRWQEGFEVNHEWTIIIEQLLQEP
jgi:hypothetical protein